MNPDVDTLSLQKLCSTSLTGNFPLFNKEALRAPDIGNIFYKDSDKRLVARSEARILGIQAHRVVSGPKSIYNTKLSLVVLGMEV